MPVRRLQAYRFPVVHCPLGLAILVRLADHEKIRHAKLCRDRVLEQLHTTFMFLRRGLVILPSWV